MANKELLGTSLHDLMTLEKEARAFGFEWPDANTIIEQAQSECAEIREAIHAQESIERIQEEVGDLLHTAISLCMFLKLDVKQTMAVIVKKFGTRLAMVKQLTEEQGLDSLKGRSYPFMLELWQEAKKRTE